MKTKTNVYVFYRSKRNVSITIGCHQPALTCIGSYCSGVPRTGKVHSTVRFRKQQRELSFRDWRICGRGVRQGYLVDRYIVAFAFPSRAQAYVYYIARYPL